MKVQFRSEKGFTLVELLATISIFSMVIALTSTLLFQSIDYNESTTEKVNLVQNTNLIVNELNKQYIEKKNSGAINSKFDLCHNGFDEITINYVKVDNEFMQISDNCIKDIENQEILPIEISTINDNGQEILIKTAWIDQKENWQLNIEKKKEDYNIVNSTKLECTISNNTEYINTIYIGNNYENSKRNPCYKFDKNAYFPAGLTMHNHGYIEVGETLRIEGDTGLTMHNQVDIVVIGDMHIEKNDDLTISNQSTITVGGDLYINNGISINNHGTLTVDGNIYVRGNKDIIIAKHGNISYKEIIYINE